MDIANTVFNNFMKNLSNYCKNPMIDYAISYGSRVMPQSHIKAEATGLIDFIFAIKDVSQFHSVNLQAHASHYSAMSRFFRIEFIKWIQSKGAQTYFNTYAKCNTTGCMFKYGIIQTDHLIKDLTSWNNFYVAGRMQKPFIVLHPNEEVERSQMINLNAAVAMVLLTSPHQLDPNDLTELYQRIASMSYKGDIRMKFAENPNKVKNIVNYQKEHFDLMYSNIAHELIGQKASYLRLLLPEYLRDSHNVVELNEKLSNIVNRSSRVEALKGIATVNPDKTLHYLGKKVLKRFSA